MPDGTILPTETLAVALARKIRRARFLSGSSMTDEQVEAWCKQDQWACVKLMKADCLSLQDVHAKLEVLCDRLRNELNTDFEVPTVTYMLAESARAGVAQMIEMHAAADPETAEPAEG